VIDSILIGMSGLDSFSEGLRVISNNAANLNTPGFKGSATQFGDLVFADSGVGGGRPRDTGFGVTTFGAGLNFKQGQLQSDGKPLDLGIQGDGMFTLRDEQGKLHYTRAGEFHFDEKGTLVDATGNQQVVSVDASGAQGVFSLTGNGTNPARATTTVTFSGNVSSTATSVPVANVVVLDDKGDSHSLSLKLTPNGIVPNLWDVAVNDDGPNGGTTIGRGQLQFIGSSVDTADPSMNGTFTVTYKGTKILMDFTHDVTLSAGSPDNALKEASHDGWTTGTLTGTSFDQTGTLIYAYSNGQTVKGAQLQLARFDSTDAVKSVGNNEFDATNSANWHLGTAGEGGFGGIASSVVELSNVDLSQEFSDLVIMQRGYQASSQVVSTANDMLQELFSMSGNK